MYNHILYFSYWVVNFVVLLILNWIFPQSVVLGNWRFTAAEAAIYSAFWQTFFIWIIWDYLLARGVRIQSGISIWIYFWAVNIVGVWILARLPHLLGLGIVSWYWAVAIGTLANWLQRIAWNIITKK